MQKYVSINYYYFGIGKSTKLIFFAKLLLHLS